MTGSEPLEADVSLIVFMEVRLGVFLSLRRILLFAPCFLEFGDEILFVFGDSLLDFLPSGWTVLVLHSHDAVNYLVNFLFVFACNFYSCFREDLLKVLEIASHNGLLPE